MRLFLDANIPAYAVGKPHPLKEPCIAVLDIVERYPRAFVTDVEVLQELLHRYLAIRDWERGRPALEAFSGLLSRRVLPIEAVDVLRAARLVEQFGHLQARDLLHIAVMRRHGIRHVITADRGFETVPDLVRLVPTSLDTIEQLAAHSNETARRN